MLLSQRTYSVKDPCLIAHNLLYLESRDASGTQGHLYTLCTCPHTDTCQHIIEDKILFSKQETISFDSFLLIINTHACTCVCGACAMSCMMKSRRKLWIGLRQGVCQPCWVRKLTNPRLLERLLLRSTRTTGSCYPVWLYGVLRIWTPVLTPMHQALYLLKQVWTSVHTHFHLPWQYCSVNLWPWECKPNLLSNCP